MNKRLEEFQRLLDIMNRLRVECPWDKKQTFESLRTMTLEESFELTDAIISESYDDIKKELGDLLLHIVFYAKIAEEENRFDIYDVLKSINDKLVFRHNHIFGEIKLESSEEVAQNWERIKLKEGHNKTVLGGVPNSLPALIKAHRIQDKARNVGFDWEEKDQVWEKVNEEYQELMVELEKEKTTENTKNVEEEFGDLFFSLINAARLYGINPENALEKTNKKFISRFNYLESKTIAEGRDLKTLSLAEMDKIWEEAKEKLS